MKTLSQLSHGWYLLVIQVSAHVLPLLKGSSSDHSPKVDKTLCFWLLLFSKQSSHLKISYRFVYLVYYVLQSVKMWAPWIGGPWLSLDSWFLAMVVPLAFWKDTISPWWRNDVGNKDRHERATCQPKWRFKRKQEIQKIRSWTLLFSPCDSVGSDGVIP